MRGKRLYEENFEELDRAIRWVVRRAGFFEAEGDDLVQEVHLKLIEDDYRRLASYRGESSLKSFILQIARRIIFDELRKNHGRLNRPSAIAHRSGPAGTLLEQYLRAGFSLDEAKALVRQEPWARTIDLDAIAAQLPARLPRKFVPEGDAPDPTSPPDETLHRKLEARTNDLRGQVRGYLDSQDKYVQAVFELLLQGVRISQIKRSIGPPERGDLYRLRDRHLQALRKHLEKSGLSWDEIRELLEWPDFFLDLGDDEDPDDDEGPQRG
ncbi:MAG: sigma factor [Acidobacteriota bacterium]